MGMDFKKPKKETVYMKVTKDKYELPVAVANSARELANIIGIKENSIHSAISHSKNDGWHSCYIKVELDEEG